MAVSYSRLHPTWKTILSNLPRVARNYGISYRVTSAYRSPKKQAQLYAAFLRGQSRYPAAPPGTSLHEKGLAVDIVSTNQTKLASLLAQAGVSWLGASDPVHFQLKAPRTSLKAIGSSYAQEVGYSVPTWLTYVPVIGGAFSVVKDPYAALQEKKKTLLDILFAWL